MDDWEMREILLYPDDRGLCYTWVPPDRGPYRITGLHVVTSQPLSILSVSMGGGYNMLISSAPSEPTLPVRSLADERVTQVSMRLCPQIDLEKGDFVVERLFASPLLVKPSSLIVDIDREQEHHPLPQIYGRFLVPPKRQRIKRSPEEQRQFDVDALTLILESKGIMRRALERCARCDAYKIGTEPCLMCAKEVARG